LKQSNACYMNLNKDVDKKQRTLGIGNGDCNATNL